MPSFGRRHGWLQVAFVSGVLALLMLTDDNGDLLWRAVVGVVAAPVCAYAVSRVWRGEPPTSDGTAGAATGRRPIVDESEPR